MSEFTISDVEQALLGSLLLDPTLLASIDATPDDFLTPERRKVFEVARALGPSADVVTICAKLLGDLTVLAPNVVIAEAMESVPSAHNAPAYLAQLRALRAAGTTCGGKPVVLSPGQHHVGGGDICVGTDHFASRVLAMIPEGTLYRRGNDVGLIVGEPGNRRFEPLTSDATRRLVDGHVALFRSGPGDDAPAPPPPSSEAVQAAPGDRLRFLPCSRDLGGLVADAARSHPKVRDLVMLTPFPVFRPDWTLSPPGFDQGIYYDVPTELIGLPRPPVSVIYDALIDFPFRDDASRFNAIGLMLTPLIRHAVENVPFHLVHSSMERTGKTKLVEMIGQVITGRAPPAIQVSEREEETEKRVTSAMRAGKPILFFDNLRDYLDSASLAALATARTWEGRVLGASALASFPNRSTVILTGNNVRATGELVKRTVPILLQPLDGAPEDRTDFAHPDLSDYVARMRPSILGALVNLVEIWIARGKPNGPHRMGGFEAWARAVGGILAGSPWLGNAPAWRRESNPEGEDLSHLVKLWGESQTIPRMTTAAAVAEFAKASGIFPGCFLKDGPGGVVSFARRVLATYKDRPVDGYIIRRVGSGSSSFWRLENCS